MQASKRILKDMCRIIGHEWVTLSHACHRCGWIPIYGVVLEHRRGKTGTVYYANLLRPGEGYRVQHRTVVFDNPIPAEVHIQISIGDTSPWGSQEFVGDGVRKGFRVKP